MERVSDEMRDLAQKVIEENPEDFDWIDYDNIKFGFLESDKRKHSKGRMIHGECKKTNTEVKALTGFDFIIKFYEPNIAYMTDEQREILMYHELLHATMRNGGAAIVPHDYIIGEFKKVVDKYGIEWAKPGSCPMEQEGGDDA